MSKEPEYTGTKQLERMLPEALASASRADEQHFEFDDLTGLATARCKQGEAWEMPEHLSRCGLCLEAFQAVLEGMPAVSAAALQRFVAVRTPRLVAFPWRTALRIAAIAAILLTAFGLFSQLAGRTTAHVSGGVIVLPDGKVLPRGAAIPGNIAVTAAEDTITTLSDGSTVELSKDTQVSFGKSVVTLNAGKLVAAVVKQKPGQHFVVKTPLGDVVVVGTRFSVTCGTEDVLVYQSSAGQTHQHKAVVQAVRIAVAEGVVRVKRLGEQVNVTANQTAVLRENEPGIEVK